MLPGGGSGISRKVLAFLPKESAYNELIGSETIHKADQCITIEQRPDLQPDDEDPND